MSKTIIDLATAKHKSSKPPVFRIGDTVSVHAKIREGDKERVQKFIGVVIGRKGSGVGETFTVRRIVANQGVERIFMLHSPLIDRVEVLSSGKVRRAKLYYLRDRIGKARKLRKKNPIKQDAPNTQTERGHQPAETGNDTEPVLATVDV